MQYSTIATLMNILSVLSRTSKYNFCVIILLLDVIHYVQAKNLITNNKKRKIQFFERHKNVKNSCTRSLNGRKDHYPWAIFLYFMSIIYTH